MLAVYRDRRRQYSSSGQDAHRRRSRPRRAPTRLPGFPLLDRAYRKEQAMTRFNKAALVGLAASLAMAPAASANRHGHGHTKCATAPCFTRRATHSNRSTLRHASKVRIPSDDAVVSNPLSALSADSSTSTYVFPSELAVPARPSNQLDIPFRTAP